MFVFKVCFGRELTAVNLIYRPKKCIARIFRISKVKRTSPQYRNHLPNLTVIQNSTSLEPIYIVKIN